MQRRVDAVVFAGPGRAELREVDVTGPEAGEVWVATTISALSNGTERWALLDELRSAYSTGTSFPCVAGYQRAGVVTELGEGVTDVAVGDRVAVVASPERSAFAGLDSMWGCHLSAGPASEYLKLPSEVSDLDASAAVVAQVGWNAASRLRTSPGDAVAVWGDGLVGQLAAQAATDRGMNVVLVGHRRGRLDVAAATGLSTVNSHDDDWSEALLALADGKLGAVIDTIQRRDVQLDYLPLLRGEPYPQIVFSGFTTDDGFVQDGHLQAIEASVDFVVGCRRDRIEATLASFADGKLDFASLVSHHLRPGDAEGAYAELVSGGGELLGVVFDWQAAD